MPPGAVPPPQTLEDLRNNRVKRVEGDGRRVIIQEPDNRTIIRQDNRAVIQSDEAARVRSMAPTARVEQGPPGITRTIVDGPGGRVVTETGPNGELIRRFRIAPDGREDIIIDNRRRERDRFGRNVLIGAGIGVGIVAGAAILNSIVRVPPPRVVIPREKYILRSEGASDRDLDEALDAPPVEAITDRYSLDQIRATARLRDRMRRIDLDDVNFEFGSWRVAPAEYGKLERIARAMERVIRRNPNEVFLIEGHTDAVGSEIDNLTLSDRRAESVAQVLSREFEVPFENLATQGYGESELKIVTQKPERQNRRVAVRRITPLLARNNEPPPPPRRVRDREDEREIDLRRDERHRYWERRRYERRYEQR